MNEITDAAIIGGGPAGLTAAVYARRAGLSTTVFSSPEPGSQLLKTESIENYPGFPEPVSGYDLLDNMQKQASGAGAEIIEETVIEAELKKTPFRLKTDSGKNFMARTVIIATGAVPRSLGLDSEKKFAGKGVSSCAVCDGFFFRGKTVTVAGGGDTALGEALYLAKIAAKVYLVHRRNEFRGTESLQKRIHAVANIETIMNSVITEIDGGKKVEKLVRHSSPRGFFRAGQPQLRHARIPGGKRFRFPDPLDAPYAGQDILRLPDHAHAQRHGVRSLSGQIHRADHPAHVQDDRCGA